MQNGGPKQTRQALRKALALFRQKGGILRTATALRLGIHPQTLIQLRQEGKIIALARGLYRLAEATPLGHPDLVTVALRVPNGVIYLLSALDYHEMTTHNPHEVCIAIPRNSEPPRLKHPPIKAMRLSPSMYLPGIESHQLDGQKVKIYSREKTLVDCFRKRHDIGMDTMLEAMRRYKEQGAMKIDTIIDYARQCRVYSKMAPYLESLLT